jgi:hypothetical protein
MNVNSWEVAMVAQRMKLSLHVGTSSGDLNLNFGERTGNIPSPKYSVSLILKVHDTDDPKITAKLLFLNILKPSGFLYVPAGLTSKNSTWCSLCVDCFVRISEQTATCALYNVN